MEKKAEKVYCWLRTYIDENKIYNNARLPSENVLSRKLSVSRDTIRIALSRLADEGLIQKRKGSGTYINQERVLNYTKEEESGLAKVGLILQGQDRNANSALIEGIRSVMPAEKVELCIFLTDNKFSMERRFLQTAVHSNFKGFIVDGVKASLPNPNLDYYQQIYQKQIPVIFYNNFYKSLEFPRVIVNDRQCADRLLGLLIKAGHRNIAGIFIYDNYQSVEKFQGMITAMKRYGVEFQDDYMKWCVSNEAHDEKFAHSIEKFLKSLPRCTAVVCCNYMIYCLVKNVLKKQGRPVPEEYSLVCFDYSGEDWVQEGVTCSIHQGYQMGVQVAVRLQKMMEKGVCEGSKYSCVMPPVIYEGRTVALLQKQSVKNNKVMQKKGRLR